MKRKLCEFCKQFRDIEVKPCGNGDLGVRAVWLDNSICLMIDKNMAAGHIQMEYCPKCGRKLTGGIR